MPAGLHQIDVLDSLYQTASERDYSFQGSWVDLVEITLPVERLVLTLLQLPTTLEEQSKLRAGQITHLRGSLGIIVSCGIPILTVERCLHSSNLPFQLGNARISSFALFPLLRGCGDAGTVGLCTSLAFFGRCVVSDASNLESATMVASSSSPDIALSRLSLESRGWRDPCSHCRRAGSNDRSMQRVQHAQLGQRGVKMQVFRRRRQFRQ